MSKAINLTGQKFGRLAVLYRITSKDHRARWHCICDCGNEIDIDSNKIKSGHTRSCGCLKQEFMDNGGSNKTHGKTKTRLYRIWGGMLSRCENPNREKFKKDYQDRFITVCPEWHDFSVFHDWALANGYADNLMIDRIDNNGSYKPDNCRWVTAKVQGNNKRNNRYFTYNNETKTIAQWADVTGMKYSILYYRLVIKGLNVEKALFLWGYYENAGKKSRLAV
jgi:hypothetical protein